LEFVNIESNQFCFGIEGSLPKAADVIIRHVTSSRGGALSGVVQQAHGKFFDRS
jgi:hypothetical protein